MKLFDFQIVSLMVFLKYNRQLVDPEYWRLFRADDILTNIQQLNLHVVMLLYSIFGFTSSILITKAVVKVLKNLVMILDQSPGFYIIFSKK